MLWLVVPLTAGLSLGRVHEFTHTTSLLAGALLLALFAVFQHRRWPPASLPAACLSVFLAGVASYALHRPRIAAWDALPPREARLDLEIERSFASRDPKQARGLARILAASGPLQEVVGQRAYFSLNLKKGQPPPLRSSVVSTMGVIESLPRDPPVSSFDGYLANAGVNFRFGRGRILSEKVAAGSYYQFCARAARRLADILGAGVEAKQPTLTGVLRAMMLGQQNELTDEQVTQFRETGTMHVFSISGLHIAVIATGVHALLSLMRAPRLLRCPLELVALWLYVDVTGAAPSAIRAFVMVAVIEVALAFRRPHNPISALAGSALVILVFDPLQLFSASFQMSYGIVAALLLLGLPMSESWQSRLTLFRDLPKVTWGRRRMLIDAWWRGLLTALAIGTAASLVSAVTGVLFFQLFTPGAFIANLWLIPASTIVIYMGSLSLIFGLIGFSAGSVLANHAALLVLWGIDKAMRVTTQLPAMWFNAHFRSTTVGSIALGVLLLILMMGYAKGWRGWQRGYWAPFAVVALMLVFGVTFP